MKTMTRINRKGVRFELFAHDNSTRVVCHGKSIVVPISFDEFDRLWYRYQIGNESVQVVFPTLNAAQREFLITGLTQQDWDRIFPKDK
jgi:hypothetical protein